MELILPEKSRKTGTLKSSATFTWKFSSSEKTRASRNGDFANQLPTSRLPECFPILIYSLGLFSHSKI